MLQPLNLTRLTRTILGVSIAIALSLFFRVQSVEADRASRKLSRAIGYTVVDASSVSRTVEDKSGDKLLVLASGSVFKVEFLYLDPLSLTDVIVLAKPVPDEIRQQYAGKLPEHYLYTYKLLIDGDDLYDATPAR
ncbi:MAG: hypothetical protein AAB353_14480 [Candidatus Hydrogenedentota bacterium]